MKKINLLLAAPFLAYALSSCTPKIEDTWTTNDFTLTKTSKEISVKFPGNLSDTVSYPTEYIDVPPFGSLDEVRGYRHISIPGQWDSGTELKYVYSGNDADKEERDAYVKIYSAYVTSDKKSD